jgi:signal peptidase II
VRAVQERGPRPALSAAPTRLGVVAAGAAAVVVALDQVTKWWALERLEGEPIDLGVVRLAVSRNSGAAFGLGEGFAPVLVVVAIVLLVVLVRGGQMLAGRLSAVAVGFVLGGAVGNLLDRLFRDGGWLQGAVVDFVDLGWWPVFNVADSAITVGAAALVVGTWRRDARA